MNKKLLLLLSLSAIPAGAMETQERAFLTPDEVLQKADPLPEELADAQKWIKENEDLWAQLQFPDQGGIEALNLRNTLVKQGLRDRNLTMGSGANFTFMHPQFVVKFAGFNNRLLSKISAQGKDPWSPEVRNNLERVVSQVLNTASPTHQHTSALAYYLLMKKRLEGKRVQPVATYAVPYGANSTFHDGNYVIVQERMPEHYMPLTQLEEKDLHAIVDKPLFADLADVVDAGAWALNAGKLFYDRETGKLFFCDLEGPNNEAYGPKAKWPRAIFDNGPETEAARASKWDHNRFYEGCGYDSMRSVIILKRKKMPCESPKEVQERAEKEEKELLNEWDRIKEERKKS
jgi:hypothetical protein